MVYSEPVPAGNFYEWLYLLDQEQAETVRRRGCLGCGGRLHRADYPRKPRGGPSDLGLTYDKRRSFCCAREGCRRRATPPSVRFLGRRVYLGVAVVLHAALQGGQAPRHVTRLRQLLGSELPIDRRTLARWLTWWREQLPQSRSWHALRAHLMPPLCPRTLPAGLLARLSADREPSAALAALLRLLSPLSIGPLVTLSQGGR